MTAKLDFKRYRGKGHGRRAFWVLVAVTALFVVGAGRGSGGDHRPSRALREAHHITSLETLREQLAEGSWWLEREGVSADQQRRLAEIDRLKEASVRLSAQTLEFGFDMLNGAAQVLDPDQRAALVAHWRSES